MLGSRPHHELERSTHHPAASRHGMPISTPIAPPARSLGTLYSLTARRRFVRDASERASAIQYSSNHPRPISASLIAAARRLRREPRVRKVEGAETDVVTDQLSREGVEIITGTAR